ncbi:MAG: hypothetical protein P8J78_07710 [Maricaulis sp.]|jgi:hypothetical protein|nr:hypothetical protein [Maricaulis sp.]MDG2044479.1 hypothetical protein [Maricaulis sp.]
MFIVRAAIWLGVISLFVPQGFAGENIELPFNTETVQIDAGEWCEGRETICEVGEEAARVGGFLADIAAERLEVAITEYNEEND